jgi:hypothetical protein
MAAAREVGFLGFGFCPRLGFIPVDLGPACEWGERFPKRAGTFAGEPLRMREHLAESRTMKAVARQALLLSGLPAWR